MNRILIAALAAITLGGCATVDTGYRGVVLNWGKPTGEIKTEGISFLMPFSGYDVKPMNVQTVADSIETSAASKDLQVVKTKVTVNYHLDPAQVIAIYDKLREDYQVRVLDPTVHEAVKASTARFVANDLIAHRNEVRDTIDHNLRDAMKPYGIIVDQVLITDFAFDSTFQQAVENKVAAQQELLTATINAQKAKAVAIGQAEAQQAQRQTLTPALLQKEMLDKWDGHLPTYMTGGNGSPFAVLRVGAHD